MPSHELRTPTRRTPRALGRRPADPQRPVLRLGKYLTGLIPTHPSSADYLASVTDWGMYENDQFGVCGPTALANQRKQITAYLNQIEVSPTQNDVFDLYRRSGNPDFNPRTTQGDGGVVLADMLSSALSGGLAGVRPLAYAAVDVAQVDQLRAAIALFGSVVAGVTLDEAQEQQTDAHQPWDYVRRSREWGGHCVLIGGYTGQVGRGMADLQLISWAERIGCTDDFAARQLDEAYVVVWPEMLSNREFQDGVDVAALARDYQALTGRPFPVSPAGPATPPAPPPAADSFRSELADFVVRAQAWLQRTDHAEAEGARFRG